MVVNLGCNHKSNMYHNDSGKLNHCANEINHQFLITLKCCQTIDTISSDDIHAMMIFIDEHTKISMLTQTSGFIIYPFLSMPIHMITQRGMKP